LTRSNGCGSPSTTSPAASSASSGNSPRRGRQIARRLNRVAADHYVYALTDYREGDRTIALARAVA
jgi:hypothetical protein